MSFCPAWIPCCVLLFGIVSCKNKKEEEPSGNTFDKEAMLANIGQSVALAAYTSMNESLLALEEAGQAFNTKQDEATLETLRSRFLETYAAWETCSVFELGPAADKSLRLAVNTFPVDTARINGNILTGIYDLNEAQNSDAKGLPALDFLLFGHGNAASTVLWFKDAAKGEHRVQYTLANIDLTKVHTQAVYNAWLASGDNYLGTFKSNSGSSVGSSLGMLVNQINYEFELIKNARVGIPLGKKTLGVTQPEKVEAVYSGVSRTLAIADLDGIEAAFSGGTGKGIDDYLDALGAKYDNQNLSTAIKAGFADVRTKLQAVDDPLRETIATNPAAVESAYASMEQLIVLLKADMPSQLGIQITYQDNDGD